MRGNVRFLASLLLVAMIFSSLGYLGRDVIALDDDAPENDESYSETIPTETEEALTEETPMSPTPTEAFEVEEKEELSKPENEYRKITAEIYSGGDYSENIPSEITISVSGIMPDDIVAKAYPTNKDSIDVVASFDITLFDGEGNVYEPGEDLVSVSFEGGKVAELISCGAVLAVYHEDDEGSVISVETIEAENGIEITTDSFSEFTIYNITDAASINGRSFIIYGTVSSRNYALTSNEIGISNVQSIIHAAQVKVIGGLITPNNTNDEPVLWKFEAVNTDENGNPVMVDRGNNGNVTIGSTSVNFGSGEYRFYITTEVGGTKKYLKMETTSDKDERLILSDEPTELTVVFNKGKIAIGDFADNGKYHGLRLRSKSGYDYCADQSTGLTGGMCYWQSLADEKLGSEVILALSYPAASGDTRTKHNRPGTNNIALGDVTTFTVPEPDTYEYESYGGSDHLRYKYRFTGWKVQSNDIYLQPGDTFTIPSNWSKTVKLQAQWEYVESSCKVTYVLNTPNNAVWTPSIVGIDDTGFEVLGTDATKYRVKGLTEDYYRSNNAAGVFKGWKTETGAIIDPCELTIEELRAYDKTNDGNIIFTGQWDNTNKAYAVFSVCLNAGTVDKDPIEQVSTFNDSTKFSGAVYATGAEFVKADDYGTAPYLTTLPYDEPGHPSSENDPTGRIFMSYFTNAAEYGIEGDRLGSANADALIRGSVTTPMKGDNNAIFTQTDRYLGPRDYSGSTLQIKEIPDDEYIFEKLKATGKTFYNEDGTVIDYEDLDSDHYSIRWSCVKLQSNGFRIDGVLIKKASFIVIEKTFAGSENAINEAINNPFYIDVTKIEDPSDPNNLILSSEPSDKLSLKMTDMTSNGPLKGKITEGEYGYIDRTGNTYKWVIQVDDPGEYYIEEKNFDVEDYGVISQFSVKTTDGSGDVSLRQWSGIIKASTTGKSLDEVKLSDINTASLINTYSKLGVFSIMKRDSDTVGTAMPDVGFNVYPVKTYTSESEISSNLGSILSSDPLLFSKTDDSTTDEVIWSPSGQATDGSLVKTDSKGNLNFLLPFDDDEVLRYVISEQLPTGYEGPAPVFLIEVRSVVIGGKTYPSYSVSVLEGSGVTPSYYNGITDDQGNSVVSGALVKNKAKNVHIEAFKEWGANSRSGINDVTITITGKYGDGTVVSSKNVILNDANNWSYDSDLEGDEFPGALGNRPITYTLEETKIGRHVKGSDKFNLWTVTSSATYKSGGSVILTDLQKADDISVKFHNEFTDGSAADINVKLADHLTKEDIPGTLMIYKKSEGGSLFEYGDTTDEVALVSEIKGSETITLNEGTYYIAQSVSSEGYRKATGKAKIVVDQNGSVSFFEAGDSDGLISFEPDTLRVIFENTKLTAIPTGYVSTIGPMKLILIGGTVLLSLALISTRRKRKPKIRKVKNNWVPEDLV